MDSGRLLEVDSRHLRMFPVRLWGQSGYARKECLEEVDKEYVVSLAVLDLVVLVGVLSLDLRVSGVSYVNYEEGKMLKWNSRRRRERGCRAARFANARLALMPMTWLEDSSCIDEER